MRPTRTLLPLNGQLEIAGEIFFNHEVGLDLDVRVVFIWHPLLGELAVTEHDGILLRFLDEEVPSWVCAQLGKERWEAMSVKQLLDTFAARRAAREDGRFQ